MFAARRSWIPIALVLLAFAPFIGTLGADFTNYDDPRYVTENSLILNLELSRVHAIFSSVTFLAWAPITILSYAIDHAVWGLRPFGFHLTNVLLHALTTLLLYFFVRTVFSREDSKEAVIPAFIGAGLFAIHPVQVETVAWIAERKNLLGMVFMLGAFLAWLRARSGGFNAVPYLLSCLLLALALMAKVQAVILPPLLFLYEVFGAPGSRAARLSPGKLIALLSPPFLIALGFGLLSMNVGDVERVDRLTGDLQGAFATAPVLVLIYLKDLLLPINRTVILEGPVYSSILGPVPLLAWFAVGAWVITAWRARKERPHVAFFSLWFLIALLPVLHFVPNTPLIGDRYQYWANPGIFALAGLGAAALHRLLDASWRPVVTGLCAATAGLLLALTVEYVPAWRDSLSLWTRAIEKAPGHTFALNQLGRAYLDTGKVDEAETLFRAALVKEPNNPLARANLGYTLIKRGFPIDGMRQLERASRGGARFGRQGDVFSRMWNHVGTDHVAEGRMRNAAAAFHQALTLMPGNHKARANLGAAMIALGRYHEAERHLQESITGEPNNPKARVNMAAALLALNRLDEAEAQLEEALRIDPRNPHAVYNQACVEVRRARHDRAIALLERLPTLGFSNADHMEADPDLEPLRKDPRFGALVRRIREAGE